jgi:DNA-3-methyladenine glycosylase I
VADFAKADVQRLMGDDGIVRNRAKIEAAIANARAFLVIKRECGSFASYVWQFVGRKPIQNTWRGLREIPAETEESRVLSVT